MKAAVVIVHGFGEYRELYAHVAEFLEGRGFAVFTSDLRGHGHATGRRGHVETWSEYLDDVGAMVETARESSPGLPIFLLGNSMGGLIAADYALHHAGQLAGLVLLAPAVGKIGVHPFLLFLSRAFSRIWPTFTLDSGIERSRMTRDPAAIARLDADPLVHNLGSARMGAELQKAVARVRRDAARLTLPVLIQHGEADQITSPDSSREFFESIGASEKTLKIYPGAYHNLVIDLVKEDVMRDVDHWITRQLGIATPPR